MNYFVNFKDILFKRPKDLIPELDFLRSLAIILVFLTHSAMYFLSYGGVGNVISHNPLIIGGWVGVDIFFVLSGFLIGSKLWSEFREKGKINYKSFIIKRTLRIWPLFYFFIILFLIVRGPLKPDWLFSDLYFLSNYLGEGGIKGSWSLSTEEQFYILMPILLFTFNKFKLTLKSGRYFCLALLVLSPLIRYFSWNIATANEVATLALEIKKIYYPFHTHMDGLIMGVLLSNIYIDKSLKKKLSPLKVTILLGIGTLIFYVLRREMKIYFNYSFLALSFGFILWVLIHYKSFLTRLFSLNVFHLIAKLSFGIYLVHTQFFIWSTPTLIKLGSNLDPILHYMIFAFVSFVSCMIITTITYLLIEWPSLQLKKHLLIKTNK